MALREENSALHWAATRPEDNTPATAVAVGHFVQVGQHPTTECYGHFGPKRPPLEVAERPRVRVGTVPVPAARPAATCNARRARTFAPGAPRCRHVGQRHQGAVPGGVWRVLAG
jgi:hypothetical protein